MAIAKRFRVSHEDVFAHGAYIKGSVEPVFDFEKSSKDQKVQAVDVNARGEGSGLLMWQVTVLDADEEASKKETALTVKFACRHQPVPPKNETPFPWTPVEFEGLSALPYVDDSGVRVENGRIQGRTRIAWSFRAEGMRAPAGPAGGGSGAVKPAAGDGAGKGA